MAGILGSTARSHLAGEANSQRRRHAEGSATRRVAGWAGAQATPGTVEGSSLVFRDLLRDACFHYPERCAMFLNRLFSTLNWTVTEFVAMVKVAPCRRCCSTTFPLRFLAPAPTALGHVANV